MKEDVYYAINHIIINMPCLEEGVFLLNNFGVISSEYGVMNPYSVKIKFDFLNYKIK